MTSLPSDAVDGGRIFGHMHRMIQRQQEDAGADANALGARGDGGGDDQQLPCLSLRVIGSLFLHIISAL
jgi:hypothetical protein